MRGGQRSEAPGPQGTLELGRIDREVRALSDPRIDHVAEAFGAELGQQAADPSGSAEAGERAAEVRDPSSGTGGAAESASEQLAGIVHPVRKRATCFGAGRSARR